MKTYAIILIFALSFLVVIGCAAAVTKDDLLKALDSALADGQIDASEKTHLLGLLDSYLGGEQPKFALPDLVITDIQIEPVNPEMALPTKGYNLTAKVTITNIGNESAGLGQDEMCTIINKVNADGTVGDKIDQICTGDTIAPGKTFLFDFSLSPFKYDAGGTYEVYANVDSTHTQVESNETNNEATKAFQVYT